MFILKHFKTVTLFTPKLIYNRFGKNVSKKELWCYLFVVCQVELIFMSTLSYQFVAFIQQILRRENAFTFSCKA